MKYWLLGTILVDVALLLAVLLAIVLVVQFVRTRNIGFLWLVAAVFIWPRLGGLGARTVIQRLIRHQPVNWYPASLVQQGRMTIGTFIVSLNAVEEMIGTLLLLVAVFYLGRRTLPRTTPAA